MTERRAYAPGVKGAAAVLGLLACIAASAGEAKRSPVTLRVMTRNLYLGANLDAIVQAKSTSEAFRAVEKGWADVQANDFPTRARAIAKEIASAKPDFVGFQELSLYRTQTPADFTVTPSTTVALDYVKELRKALTARKLRYRFLAVGNATDAELPSGDPPKMDIRLTIRDGLLVRIDKKIKIRRVRTGLYSTTTPLFGGFVIAKRGWALADATVAGRTFRVITTHLESFNDTSQVAQSLELAAPGGPADTKLPTVLLGDLNSRADGTGHHRAPTCSPRDSRIRGRRCIRPTSGSPAATAMTCAKSAARSTAASTTYCCATASGPLRRESLARSRATESPAYGRRTTPASGRGCVSPRTLGPDQDRRAAQCLIEQLLQHRVRNANATVGDGLADRPRRVGPVDGDRPTLRQPVRTFENAETPSAPGPKGPPLSVGMSRWLT